MLDKGNVKITAVDVDEIVSDRLKRKFVAFDTETTGLSCMTDRIIELGVVRFNNGIETDSYGTLIDSKKSISEAASAVNHITNKMIKDYGISEAKAYGELADFIPDVLDGNTIICAHNAKFDMAFLSAALSRMGYNGNIYYADTLSLAKSRIRNLENYKQDTVAAYFGITNSRSHRAVSDAETCGEILLKLLELSPEDRLAEPIDEKNIPNDEEKEVCAVILDILKNSAYDSGNVRFYRNSANYIDVIHVYNIFKFKVSANKRYIIIPEKELCETVLNTENCTKTEGFENIRVYFDTPFDLWKIGPAMVRCYDRIHGESQAYSEFNHYEKQFISNCSLYEIKNKDELIRNAVERMIQRKETAEKAKIKEEEKALIKAEKAEKSSEKEERAAVIQRLRSEITDECSAENIRKIIEISACSRKRAIIKLDDYGTALKIYESVSEASADMSLAPKTIRDVANGKGKHAGGFCWKYADEYVDQVG